MEKSRTSKVLILSSGQAMTALVTVLSSAVLTRLLAQGEFGTYRQAMLAMSFAAPFLMLGLDRVLFAFLPGEQRRPRAVLVENLSLLFGAGGLLTAFVLFGGNHVLARRFNNPDLVAVLPWFALYSLLTFPATAASGCLLARQRTGTLAAFNVGTRLVAFLAVVSLCYYWRTSQAALAGVLAGAVVVFVAGLSLMWRACPGTDWKPRWSGLRNQLAFAIPLGLATLIGSISLSLDQVLVSMRCSKEEFAVYTLGAMEIPLIAMITGSITSVVMVDYARYYKEGRTGEVVRLMQQAMSKSALMLLPVMMFLFCIAPSLFRVLYGAKYEHAAVPFRIYLLLLPIRTLTFGAVIQCTGSSRPILMQSVLGLVATAALAWTLIPLLGPSGAAVGSVTSIYLISVPFLMIVLKRRLGTPIIAMFPWRALLRIFTGSLVAFIVSILVLQWSDCGDIARIIIAATAFFPVVIASLTFLGMINLKLIQVKGLKLVSDTMSG